MEQKPPKRRPGRPAQHGEVKRDFFQTRIRGSLKQRLEEDAAKEGRSLSEEIELRLEGSYSRIEDRFGGVAGLRMAIMLTAGFQYAGERQAQVQGHPEWTADQWLADRNCFEHALLQLVRSVWEHNPEPVTHRDFYRFCERLFNGRYGLELSEQFRAQLQAEAAAREAEAAAKSDEAA